MRALGAGLIAGLLLATAATAQTRFVIQPEAEPVEETAPSEVAPPVPAPAAEPAPFVEMDVPPAPEPTPAPMGSAGLLDRYMDFAMTKLDHALELDLYGTTAQLPAGVISVKYQYRYIVADERFDSFKERGDLLPEVSFTDGDGEEIVSVNLNGKGRGTVHLFQFSLGLTDPIDFFTEISWADVRTELAPTARFGSTLSALGLEDYEDLKQLLVLLGRPPPNEVFDTDGLEFGDVQAGFSWNWYRGPEWSFSTVTSAFFPTGEIADANNDINFALGPELDRGAGGYQLLWVNNVDYRPAWLDKKLILSMEIDYKYTFPYDRPTPSSFTEPNSVVVALLELIEFDSEFFPDLTDIEPEFEWAPGQSIDALAIVAVEPSKYLTVAAQYGFNYAEAVEISSSSLEFVQLVEALELTGENYTHAVSLTAAPNMINLGQDFLGVPLPFLLSFVWERPFAGKNAIIFDPSFRIVTQFVAPIW